MNSVTICDRCDHRSCRICLGIKIDDNLKGPARGERCTGQGVGEKSALGSAAAGSTRGEDAGK